MKKAFGQSNTAKWINSIKNQDITEQKSLNAKYVPLELTVPDSDNPRRLYIDKEKIKNAPPLKDFLPFNEQNQKTFEKAYTDYCKQFDHPDQVFVDFLETAELAASIKTPEELIQPISVVYRQGKFFVEAGHRRRLAHYMLGASHIAAIIKNTEQTGVNKILLQYKENKERKDISLYEEICSLQHLNNAHQQESNKSLSIKTLCELTGTKRTRSAWLVAVLKGIEQNADLMRVIETEKVTSLEVATQIARLENKVLQTKLLKEMLASVKKLSFQQALNHIQQSTKKSTSNPKSKLIPTTPAEVKVLSKIITIVKNDPTLGRYAEEFNGLDLTDKKTLTTAWQRLLDILSTTS